MLCSYLSTGAYLSMLWVHVGARALRKVDVVISLMSLTLPYLAWGWGYMGGDREDEDGKLTAGWTCTHSLKVSQCAAHTTLHHATPHHTTPHCSGVVWCGVVPSASLRLFAMILAPRSSDRMLPVARITPRYCVCHHFTDFVVSVVVRSEGGHPCGFSPLL